MTWILTKIWELIASIATPLSDLLRFTLGPVIALFSAIYAVFQWVVEQFSDIAERVAAGQSLYEALQDLVGSNIYNALPAALADVFAFINYAIPLSELLVCVSFLIAMLGISAVIRHIKGWIPTMN